MTWSRREFGLSTLGLAASAVVAAEPVAPAPSILVPAYFYPAGQGRLDWDRMILSAAVAPITAIVNPASGPGKDRDPNYTAVLDRAARGRLGLIGYVSTHYTGRPQAEARADVDRWLKLYPQIQGFFFDEQSSEATQVDYYALLSAHARAALPGARVVANPGTTCDEVYVARKTSDVVCLFENGRGFEAFRPPAWVSKYGAGRFAVIPYAIATALAMRQALREATSRRAGVVYVTDASGANPYDRLPRYWDAEVGAVREPVDF